MRVQTAFQVRLAFRAGAVMARGACTFKQQDVTRALKATQAAGLQVHRVEIDKEGKITLVTAKDQPDQVRLNEWDV